MSTVHFGASSAAINIMPNQQDTDILRCVQFEQKKSAGGCDGSVYAAAQFADVPDETSGARLRRASDENHVDTNPLRKVVDAVERFFGSVDEGMKAMNPDECQRQLMALTLANAWI
jgi:hypothetical protein